MILEIVGAIKAELPSDQFVIAAKFNCQDCEFSAVPFRLLQSQAPRLTPKIVIQGGSSFAEQRVVLKWLEDAGVDFFDISGGTYEWPAWRGNIMTELAQRPSQRLRGSYFIEWAKEMKKVLSRAIIGTTGGWSDEVKMAEAVQHRDIDLVGLGRLLREKPDFVRCVLEKADSKAGSTAEDAVRSRL